MIQIQYIYIYKSNYSDYAGGEVTQGSWQAWNNKDYSISAINAMASKGAKMLDTITHSGEGMSLLNATYSAGSDKYMDSISFSFGNYNIKLYNLYNNTFVSNVGSSSSYETTDENTNSIVMAITTSSGKKALLMGDMNVRDRFEQYYAKRIGKVSVLKASHHGYNFSNSKELMDNTKPSIIVIPNNKDLLSYVNMGLGGKGDFGAARIYTKKYDTKVYKTGDSSDSIVVDMNGLSVYNASGNNFSSPREIPSSVSDGWYVWYNENDTKLYYYIEKNIIQSNRYVSDGTKNNNGNTNYYWLNKDGAWNNNTYNFISSDGKWFFKCTNGSNYQAKNEWITLDKKTYYFDESGVMVIGWKKIKGKWYYFNADGSMKTGWVSDGNKYYYLSPKDGSMQTGKKNIEGKSYNLGSDGVCTNCRK